MSVEVARRFVEGHRSSAPAVYSSAEPAVVLDAQRTWGRDRVAEEIEGFFGALARVLVADGITRLAVGGGETSGAVVTALGLDHFAVGSEIAPGVPVLASRSAEGISLRLTLKSGNFGEVDFYENALTAMEAPGVVAPVLDRWAARNAPGLVPKRIRNAS